MEAQELRIGNYVNLYIEYGLDLIPSKGEIIKCNDLVLIEREDIMAEPIPLNEEWLLNFGFKKVDANYEKEWLLLHTNKNTGTVDFLLNEPQTGKYKATILKYVHQLQNLYFALTGKELKLKTE